MNESQLIEAFYEDIKEQSPQGKYFCCWSRIPDWEVIAVFHNLKGYLSGRVWGLWWDELVHGSIEDSVVYHNTKDEIGESMDIMFSIDNYYSDSWDMIKGRRYYTHMVKTFPDYVPEHPPT
jgi:hypothetical protein